MKTDLKGTTPTADKCIFISPPTECTFHVGGLCAPSGPSQIVSCVINHKRLILAEEGRAVALQAFIATLDHHDRQKPISGGETITG